MAHAIYLLRLEHGNAARLLDVLEEEGRALSAGEPADREVIRLGLEYFAGYPEACHHPKEELVMRHLRLQRPRLAAPFERLMEEHATFGERTGELIADLRRSGPDADRALGVALQRYCAGYRAHMDEEERAFFPAALDALATEDWAEIGFDLFDREDPLFDHVLEDRFAALREEITRRAERDQAERAEHEEARWLEGLVDIDGFNARMRARGQDCVLVALDDGGYRLERPGAAPVHIPRCTPARAAWCAYFFWKGVDTELHPESYIPPS